MKATGIVRRIDDLGRVVIPKEIRRTMRIREGDPLEIYTNAQGEVIFKKYSPMEELMNIATQYCEVLHQNSQYPVAVCDKDHFVCVNGASKKEILERRLTTDLEDILEKRELYQAEEDFFPIEGVNRRGLAVAPIIAAGDVIGAIMYLETDKHEKEMDIESLKLTAQFLGRQMEE